MWGTHEGGGEPRRRRRCRGGFLREEEDPEDRGEPLREKESPKDGHPMVNSEGKVHLRGLVGRVVQELALFRVM